MQNRQILLSSRPEGWVTNDNFAVEETGVPAIGEGQVLVRAVYLSVDPYLRGRMNDTKSYIPPFQLGSPVDSGIVGQVIESRFDGLSEGDYVLGRLPWALISAASGAELVKLNADIAPLSYNLGILGMPGQTAWVGLKAVANLQEGENVFVSGASGAVGQVVGQIAKNMGCHVAGSAGGAEKVAYLRDLGFDAAIDYKATPNLFGAVADACPNGIDVHFENVGGAILEAVINKLNFKARIALCGYITAYNSKIEELPPGPRNLPILIGTGARMEGFIVTQYPAECMEWVKTGAKWLKEGKLQYKETVVEGLENAPDAFIGMLKGENMGKMIVKIADE